jgi:hypothetical protein
MDRFTNCNQLQELCLLQTQTRVLISAVYSLEPSLAQALATPEASQPKMKLPVVGVAIFFLL